MSENEFNPDWGDKPNELKALLLESMLEYQAVIDDLVSLNLWQARRIQQEHHKKFAYDELEEITRQKYERL